MTVNLAAPVRRWFTRHATVDTVVLPGQVPPQKPSPPAAFPASRVYRPSLHRHPYNFALYGLFGLRTRAPQPDPNAYGVMRPFEQRVDWTSPPPIRAGSREP